jgi:sterol 24-C-methyltransferase
MNESLRSQSITTVDFDISKEPIPSDPSANPFKLVVDPAMRVRLRRALFELIESHDHALTADADGAWWRALAGGPWWTVGGFRASRVGRLATHGLVRTLESIRVLPPGATEVSTLLNFGAEALVRGGQTGIFTPMFFYCARKPD